MARVDASALVDREAQRVYLAAALGEARRVEQALTAHGIDYAVAIEPYWKRTLMIFPSKLNGAAFYVPAEDLARCVELLAREGLALGLVHDLP